MALRAKEVARGGGTELAVACPQRIDPTPISVCAECDHCVGLDLDGRAMVSVNCVIADEGVAADAGARVTTIMVAPVVTISEDDSIENARWLVLDRGISALLVLGRGGKAVGVLSKTDLVRDADESPPATYVVGERGAERVVDGATVKESMTPIVFSLPETATIAAAASLMAVEHIHHVMVRSATGDVVGVVSTLDVVRWLAARERFTPRDVR
jgi:CBS domain-containing protein